MVMMEINMQEGSDSLPVTLGIAAATGLGLLTFTEDQKQTLQQVDEFLNAKVPPTELVDEPQQIGKALLPSSVNGKALPAPAEANPEPANVPKAEPAQLTTEPKAEPAAERSPQINSVAKTEAKTESVSGFPKLLSSYPYYPDLKPPTSPSHHSNSCALKSNLDC
ncbi:hypothetical protein SLE2022_029550 [Rubroshorea leprosula]